MQPVIDRKNVRRRQSNVGSLFEEIVVDVALPFPEREAGKKYIKVCNGLLR